MTNDSFKGFFSVISDVNIKNNEVFIWFIFDEWS